MVKGVVEAGNESVKPSCPEVKLFFSIGMISQSLLSMVFLSFPSVNGRVALRRTSQSHYNGCELF